MKGSSVLVSEISKHYGAVPAVDRVSIAVRAGEFLSLLGPSGSGKTTLLMMIAGFELSSAGRIHLGQRDITLAAPNKRGIGMVFQRYALFPHMTVEQNIAFPLRMRKFPKSEIERRVTDALSLVRLDGYGKRLPNALSGGQQQRVAVARALVFEPPVLLMDEPLGALDKKLRDEMQIEIRRLQQRLGVTVIYVTHDQEEALTMSDRIAVMRDGRLEQIGSPSELYDRPATSFVADFIGRTNFVDAEAVAIDSSEILLRVGRNHQIRLANPPCSGRAALAQGDRLRLGIRPEQLKLSPAGRGGGSALSAVVETVMFLGSTRALLVRLEEGPLMQVQISAGADGFNPREGEKVDLTASPQAIQLFPVAAN